MPRPGANGSEGTGGRDEKRAAPAPAGTPSTQLLDTAWEAKKRMSERISNPRIDELYDVARAAGAMGGKVTGAGGGGYLLLYCRYDRKHEVAATHAGARRGRRRLCLRSAPGLRTWRVDGDWYAMISLQRGD